MYQMPELTDIKETEVDTPFGKPSDAFIIGTLEGERVAFVGFGGWKFAGTIRADGFCYSRPVF